MSVSNYSALRIVVVGAGAAGLSCAWQLARAGHAVTLVDRGELGRGALWASGGMLAAGFEASVELDLHHDLARAFSDLLQASLDHWGDWIHALQGYSAGPLGYNQDGAVTPLNGEAELARADRVLAQAQALGITVEQIDGAALRSLEPGLASADGALVFPGDGQLDNRALAQALTSAAFAAGCRMEMRSGVKALRRRGGAVTGVELHDGRALEADRVVLATGAQGLAELPDPVTARPVKGQMLGFEVEPGQGPRHVVRGFSIYLCSKPGHRVIAGATVEPDVYDTETTEDAQQRLLALARRTLPGLGDMAPVEHWSGLRPASKDLMPLLGELEPGLIMAGGGYRNGVLLAPVIAAACLAAVTDRPLPDTAQPFTPHRAGLRARRDH
ncbi:FAD-dependent oxidoreductase [Maricaulaceae bacterium EIL42A08]|nr:FAD-dependent oxidoreductase [Maricaulaceae bacterium EIL42A08]